MKHSLWMTLLMLSSASIAQHQDHITRIEFSSSTRGYQELIILTSDSVKFSRAQAGQPKIAKTQALKKNEWQEMLKTLKKINLSELPELKSPGMKRASDGARHSTITIFTDSNQSYAHSFDDERPNEKLKALMNIIIKKREK